MSDFDRESMLDMFVYEMNQLMENLEQTVLEAESGFTSDHINEIFRIMHTIKGSAAMMMFETISETAHVIEDMFFYLREEMPEEFNVTEVTDAVLEAMDFIKGELSKIEEGEEVDGDPETILKNLNVTLNRLKGGATESSEIESVVENTSDNVFGFKKEKNEEKNIYSVVIKLEEDCEMKNIRSFTIVSNLEGGYENFSYVPEDILAENANDILEKNGLILNFETTKEIRTVLSEIMKNTYIHKISIFESLKGNKEDENTYIYDINTSLKDIEENRQVKIFDILQSLELESEYICVNDLEILNDELTSTLNIKLYSFSNNQEYIEKAINKSENIKSFDIKVTKPQIEEQPKEVKEETKEEIKEEVKDKPKKDKKPNKPKNAVQQVISVQVTKLDQLLNLMGELVIAETMVSQNPELEELELNTFNKDIRQLRKIITDVQDIVMSMRMVPLSTVFSKMHRIVRDMSKNLGKHVELVVLGEETEVDKNIIEHISDPLMHMIRNSIDHGIETDEERVACGKTEHGKVTLEAKNSGGDVLIIVKDNGKGLNTQKVLEKAQKNGMLKKPASEYSDKEINQFIFQPGFSTNEAVTNYSGRGVGMDVVINNLLTVGGTVDVDSVPGEGSQFTLKIPLTLAIIEGMIINIGDTKYTIPIISIRQSFKAKKEMIHKDPNGNEMITVRGEVYNLVKLHEFFNIETNVTDVEDGIMILVENGTKTLCLYADELVGEHQVVVKSMPKYVGKVRGISGCTLLGNGVISLIIDTAGFFNN